MGLKEWDRPIRGFIFTCSSRTEGECLSRMLFGTDKIYGPVVIRIRKGDLLFLVNIDTDVLYGVFEAVSDGGFKIEPDAWRGSYPYQVRVRIPAQLIQLTGAQRILDKFGIRRTYSKWVIISFLLKRKISIFA